MEGDGMEAEGKLVGMVWKAMEWKLKGREQEKGSRRKWYLVRVKDPRCRRPEDSSNNILPTWPLLLQHIFLYDLIFTCEESTTTAVSARAKASSL